MTRVSRAAVTHTDQQKSSAGIPPVLQTVRRMSRQQIGLLVEDLFNNTDDTLFELADRAGADGAAEHVFRIDAHYPAAACANHQGISDGG